MDALVENEIRMLKNAGILAQRMNIDVYRLLAFTYVYGALSASWSLEDGNDPRHALKMAQIAERRMFTEVQNPQP